MHLKKEAIKEFKKIYFREYGERLNDYQAQILATGFYNLMDAIFHQIPKDYYEEFFSIKKSRE